MVSKKKIIIGAPIIKNDHEVYCDISCTDSIRRYFRQTSFFSEYDRNLKQVPPSLLVIPSLANICTVAWVLGADVYVQEIDQDFLFALKIIKKNFQAMYPEMKLRGDIVSKKVVENRGYSRGEKCMLFSGGVDSLATYIRKRTEHPSLITVWGADIRLKQQEAWNRVLKDVKKFANANHVSHTYIKSNFRTFLNNHLLNSFFTGGWWARIQHGVGLLGLCSPLSYMQGMDTVYIASTCSKQDLYPWGSHPDIDNYVKWGETQVIHEGFELDKQEKIKVIADFLKREKSLKKIRVCYLSKDGRNCSECKKCYQTMVGFLLVGMDPNQFGFTMKTKTLETIKEEMIHGDYRLIDKGMLSRWELIKRAIPENWEHIRQEHQAFFQWMLKTDLDPFLKV